MRKIILFLLAFAAVVLTAHADVDSYAAFQVAMYDQTNASPPSASPSYYFAAQVDADTNGLVITSASVTVDSTDETYPLSDSDSTNFYYKSGNYLNKTSFDANYPDGYLFSLNNDGYSEYVFTGEDLFSSSIPYFTADTWSRFQSADSFQPLNLCWNSFTPNPSANGADTVVRILNFVNSVVYDSGALPPTQTNLCLPANLLDPGTPYSIELIFSDRNLDAGLPLADGAPAVEGFDNLTTSTLRTSAPKLSIVAGENSVTVSWPATESNYFLFFLESSSQLSPPSWSGVAFSFNGTRNTAVVPITGSAQFFTLVRLPLI